MNTRRNRPLIIWIAMLAVLMGTLAPSMTSLLAAARGEIPLEICTTPYNRGAASLRGHCPYCRLQQEVPAMPHAPQPLVLATITSVRQALQLAPTPPPVAPAWPPQLSRAPPQLS